MLYEMAIGDSFGACFEFVDKAEIKPEHRQLKYTLIAPSLVPLGHYTDDTQMAIAIAEAMVDGVEWNKENLSDYFVKDFRRDERRGYTTAFFTILLNCQNGTDLLQKINGKSDKSGAAMRAAPMGFFPSVQEVVEKSDIQAKITHDTKEGIFSSRVVALASHYFIYNLGPFDKLLTWLQMQEPEGMDMVFKATDAVWDSSSVSTKAFECVAAALTAIRYSSRNSIPTLKEILLGCVFYTGDVDTVATIAMGIMSHCQEINKDIPMELHDGLENGNYGRDYLAELDKKLIDKFKP